MRKPLLFLVALVCYAVTNAQPHFDLAKSKAIELVQANQDAIGLTFDKIRNTTVSSSYDDASTGMTHAYLQQTYLGLPVYNKMMVLAFKEGKVVSNAGKFIDNMEQATYNASANPSINAERAVKLAFAVRNVATPVLGAATISDNGRKYDFGKLSGTTENVIAELIWVPVEDGKQTTVHLAWQVQVAPWGTDEIWQIQMDAVNGKLIDKYNTVVNDDFSRNPQANQGVFYSPFERPEQKARNFFPNLANTTGKNAEPNTVVSATYLIIPWPYEAPSFINATTRTDPWTAAPGNASTLGWHSTGTNDYIISRGNNVYATEDTLATNTNSGTPATSSTSPNPLTFTIAPNYNVEPSQNGPMQQFCITNLFYWCNIYHDILYQYSFDEPAGNFQTNNLGRGGLGNDQVTALAQSGAAGHIGNNANFATNPDGGLGRMRMYLFNAVSTTTLHVNAPPVLVGNYAAVESGFSTANKLANVGPVTGQVVYYNDDASGTTHDACGGAPANNIAGKIALINRNVCTFVVKVLNAQAAGAIAVIMVNNVAGDPIVMGGTDNTITIPAVMISQSDGALFAAQLGNNLNVTLSGTLPEPRDGDLDAGIITHEHTHGLSNRLTGGPSTTSCLNNAEEAGEGWSDYYALMLTTNWATATTADGPIGRGVGTYVLGQNPTGVGIRNYVYTTNITLNPLTYAHMGTTGAPWLFSNGSEVHNLGEIWCEALWETTWGIILQENSINTNIYNFSLSTTGGNSIAIRLVTEGLKLQPCSPGFIDGRNAILTADKNLYGGRHQCAIWTAFAKRGMGYSALQGSSNSTTDQTAAFDMPPAPVITGQPTDVSILGGQNATFTVVNNAALNGAIIIYQWQESTNGGVSYNDISNGGVYSGATTATLTLTNVPGSMNGYKYRCVLKEGCNSTTSSVATLTVSVPAGFTFNSPAPVVSNCPAAATMSTTLTATYFGGHSANITLTATVAPNVTTVTLTPSTLTTSTTSTTVTLNNTNTLTPGTYTVTVTGTSPGATTQTRDILFTINPGTGPAITAQPANQTICAGSNALFSITSASATTFQWQVSIDGGTTWTPVSNGGVYTNATTATLNLTNVPATMNGYLYRCIASTICGSTTSSSALLTVNSAPTITTQPQNVSGCTAGNATFSVTATGSSLTYQWQLSTDGGATFNNIGGATSSSYTQTGLTLAMNGYQYHVIITGICPVSPITSNNATLSVVTALSITGQPADVTVCEGSPATFTVTASGAGSYQWQLSTDGGTTWNNIPGATGSSYNIPATTAAMSGNRYRVQITGPCGNGTSNAAILTVNTLPTITSQPSSATLCAGSNNTFSVTATGTGITYQWQLSLSGCAGPWNNIAGATSSSYTLTNINAGQNNTGYRCVVTGTCAPPATSNCALLTVVTAVNITQQPADQTVCAGATATFTVAGSGAGIIYQWQLSTDGGTTWNNIAGATSASYTTPATTVAMSGYRYRCQLSNASCTTPGVSNAAILTVNSLPAISAQPQNASVCVGGNNTFSVTASGTGITYQWQLSTDGGTTWNNIAGATSSTYTVSGATAAMNGYRYRVIITGTCNPAVTSSGAILTVNTPVGITTQPVASTNVCATGTVSLSVVATGTTPAYQWQESTDGGTTWTNISNGGVYGGATTATLTLTGITANMNGNRYRVVVSGTAPCGSVTSTVSILNVTPQPVISASPLTTITTPGQTTTLTVNISPAPGITFTWQYSLDGGTTWTTVVGATGNSYVVTANTVGTYRVIVTTSAGSCTSQPVTITGNIPGILFIFPSPNNGQFNVAYYNSGGATVQRTIVIFDSKGSMVYKKQFTISGAYSLMAIDMRQHATGIYIVDVFDSNGKQLAEGKVHLR